MAKNFFKIKGADAIAKELNKFSKTFKDKVARPGLKVAIKEVEKTAKMLAPKDDGHLRQGISSLVKTKDKKGVVAKAGFLDSSVTDENGKAVIIYGAALNKELQFLQRANTQSKPTAVQKLKEVTKKKIGSFQKSMNAKARAAK